MEKPNLKGSLIDRVLEAHGRSIAGRRVAPGDRIERESLPDDLRSVSRTVWREAVQGLVARGLVAPIKRRGTIVRAEGEWDVLDPDLLGWLIQEGRADEVLRELHGFRRMIEPAAARAAAVDRSPADIETLRAALTRLAAAVDGGALDVDADVAFHTTILRATGNRMIAGLAPIIEQSLRLGLPLATGAGAPFAEAVERHRAVVQAIADGDATAAGAAMEALLSTSHEPPRAAGRSTGEGKSGPPECAP